jgi:uncharacterized C2H2 Zn-finger protein
MSDLNCPYCDHDFDDTSDMEGYTEDSVHEFECPECSKIFMASISYSIHYSEFETPCKNDDRECEFIPLVRYPVVFFGKTVGVRCRWCGDKKEIPWEESAAYGFNLEELKNKIDEEYIK